MLEKRIAAIIKVTSFCNMRCQYCYYIPSHHKKLVMEIGVLDRLIQQYLGFRDEDEARFLWHGGEPLLAGIDFFTNAVFFQNKYKQSKQIIVNNIQTNGTLIDQEWCDFFKENNFSVGISVDGPYEFHNEYRKYQNGRPTFKKVMAGVRLLRKNNFDNFGALVVIGKHNVGYPEKVYRFLIDEGFDSFDFLPVADTDSRTGNLTEMSISPEEWGEFLIRTYDCWLEDDNPDVKIRLFESASLAIMHGYPCLCTMSGGCSNIITFEPNGDVYPCDSFVLPPFQLGNILNTDLSNILYSPSAVSMRSKLGQPGDECENCEWLKVCSGGCSYNRYIIENNLSSPLYFCEARKRMFSHIENKLRRSLLRLTQNQTLI